MISEGKIKAEQDAFASLFGGAELTPLAARRRIQSRQFINEQRKPYVCSVCKDTGDVWYFDANGNRQVEDCRSCDKGEN